MASKKEDLSPHTALRIAMDEENYKMRPTYALVQCAAYFTQLAAQCTKAVKERFDNGRDGT